MSTCGYTDAVVFANSICHISLKFHIFKKTLETDHFQGFSSFTLFYKHTFCFVKQDIYKHESIFPSSSCALPSFL